MPVVHIDGQSYEFEKGQTLLQFCLDIGIELPHFCYHPALSVPANCRQCLVKAGSPAQNRVTGEVVVDERGNPVINYFPKLQTSCSLGMTDGMVVHTHRDNEEVAGAQEDNLEFLLINHPLDCPICDQAGHCPLQNLAYKYGPEGSRFEFEKVHKPKRVELGPRVTLDAERCINCTRCTRFTDEISKSNQLAIMLRGVSNYPMTAPGETFDDAYSMNVVDICPVGALTSTDFRFKARVWEMSKTPSISVYSSKGVNVDYWVRDNLIVQITPRTNIGVNDYWMADSDRLSYHHFNENRPQNGAETRSGDGSLVPSAWADGFATAADILKQADPSTILFVGSSHATVEDNYLLKRLAEVLGASAPIFLAHVEEGSGDQWLVSDDRAPNAAGCRLLGLEEISGEQLRTRIADANVVYAMEEDLIGHGGLTPEELEEKSIVLHYYNTTNHTLPHARVAFPTAMAVETVGTMVNVDGIAQRLRPAKAIKSINRSLVMEMGRSRPDDHGTPFDHWHNESNTIDCHPSWELLQKVAAAAGVELEFKSPSAILDEVASSVDSFGGLSYERMGQSGVRLQAEEATSGQQ